MIQKNPQPARHQKHEKPTARAVPKAEAFPKSRSLEYHPYSLQQKVRSGQAVAAASRKRNDEIVYQAGNQESSDRRPRGAEPLSRGHKDEAVREFTKAGVPALAPKLAQRRGRERRPHNRLRIYARRLP